MRKIILLMVLLINGFYFAQANENTQLNTNYKLPPALATKSNVLDKNPNEIYYDVDESAEFLNGGINNFKTQIKNNFQIDKVDEKDIFETSIRFIVEKDGTISNIKAVGENESFNKETVRAILKIKDKWNPAKIKGQKVRSLSGVRFTMDIE